MAVMGEIRHEHVQELIKACIIIDRFPMRSDANSSKGLTASKDVRLKPCPERMSETDFVEVSLSFCISLHTNGMAHPVPAVLPRAFHEISSQQYSIYRHGQARTG